MEERKTDPMTLTQYSLRIPEKTATLLGPRWFSPNSLAKGRYSTVSRLAAISQRRCPIAVSGLFPRSSIHLSAALYHLSASAGVVGQLSLSNGYSPVICMRIAHSLYQIVSRLAQNFQVIDGSTRL